MDMSMTVTEHDKKLLLIVGTVGFLLLFITFGLMPAISAMNDAKADLTDAEARRTDMEYNIALAEPASQNVTNARNDLLGVVAQFYPMMENRELDTLVTGLELGHKLSPLTMQISDTVPQSVTGYVASAHAGESAAATVKEDPQPAAEEGTGLGSTTATENAAAAAAAAGDAAVSEDAGVNSDATVAANIDFIYTTTVNGTASGTREDCVALLDDVAANYPSVQLTSFSITDTAASAAAEGEGAPGVISNFSFTMVIYMCDKEAIQ